MYRTLDRARFRFRAGCFSDAVIEPCVLGLAGDDEAAIPSSADAEWCRRAVSSCIVGISTARNLFLAEPVKEDMDGDLNREALFAGDGVIGMDGGVEGVA